MSPPQTPSSFEGKVGKFSIIITMTCFYGLAPFTEDPPLRENDGALKRCELIKMQKMNFENSDL